MDDFDKVFGGKKRVLVIFAHPDDAELYAGGTIARLMKSGKRVRVVKMTCGDKGSRQEKTTSRKLAQVRMEEDKRAMRVLGISAEDNVYLQIGDGEVENDLETIGKVAYQIRQFKPDIIITHNPEDVIIRFDKDSSWVNHRDHRNTGKSVIDAAYPYSRDILFFPDQLGKNGAQSHNVTEYLLVDYYGHPDEVSIDITEFTETRIAAHASHASQYNRENAQESADFFTLLPDGRRRERFRHVVAD